MADPRAGPRSDVSGEGEPILVSSTPLGDRNVNPSRTPSVVEGGEGGHYKTKAATFLTKITAK